MRNLTLLAFALLVLGCHHNNGSRLVGKWTMPDSGPPASMTFSSDGKLSFEATVNAGSFVETVIESGSYREVGNTVYMTLTDVSVRLPDAYKSLEADMAAELRKKTVLNKEGSGTVSWTGKNEMTITNSDGSSKKYIRQ